MLRIFHISVLLLVFLAGCKEPQPAPVAAPEVVVDVGRELVFDLGSLDDGGPASATQHSFLWRVQGSNGNSWLFGTIHGGVKADWAHLPPDVRKAVQKADTLVFETDVTDVDESAIANRLTLPRKVSLRTSLGEERFAKLVEYTGHPAETLDRYRPWVVHGELVGRWLPDERPVDAWMLEHAEKRNKKLAYLGTMLDQIDALDAAITIDVLGRTIDDLAGEEQSMTAAVQSYREGDVEGLRSNLFAPADVEQHAPMYDALFKKRNQAWLPKIKQHLEQGNALIVVGAGHLIGTDNLVDMLREAGWKVTPSVYEAPTSTFE